MTLTGPGAIRHHEVMTPTSPGAASDEGAVALAAHAPGAHGLARREIIRKPERICAWLEALTPGQAEVAASWAALRRCPGSHSLREAAGRIERGRGRDAMRRTLARLDVVPADPGGAHGAPRLPAVLGASGLHYDDIGCQNLLESARTAVRAAYVARRVVHPLSADHALGHFADITRAVEFEKVEGRRMFAVLCRVARDVDLPFDDLARSVMTAGSSAPGQDADAVVGAPWPSRPARRPVARRRTAGRRALTALFVVVAVLVVAAVIVGAVSIVEDVWHSNLLW